MGCWRREGEAPAEPRHCLKSQSREGERLPASPDFLSIPENLARDDIGTVVLVHEGGKGCTVEFMTLAGQTIAVVTLLANQIRQIAKDEIAHARHVAAAA